MISGQVARALDPAKIANCLVLETFQPKELLAQRKALKEAYRKGMVKESDNLKAKYNLIMRDQGYVEIPYIILGAGGHGSVMGRMLKNKLPNVEGLVIEKNQSTSDTFSNIGSATYLTGPDEFNPVPGGPLSVKNLNYTDESIATTDELGGCHIL